MKIKMQTSRCWALLLVVVMVSPAWSLTAAEQPSPAAKASVDDSKSAPESGPVPYRLAETLGWNELRALPVFEGGRKGRIMPWDTYARQVVKEITGSESPTLMLKGAVSIEDFNSPKLAAARSMFPDDKPRKFEASELLLSWIIEPDVWMEIPCLHARHEGLRKELGLKIDDDEGQPLKYVSIQQLRQGEKFGDWLQEMRVKMQAEENPDKEPEVSETDKSLGKLNTIITRFMAIIHDPHNDVTGRQRYLVRSRMAQRAASDLLAQLDRMRMQGDVSLFEQQGMRETLLAVLTAAPAMSELENEGDLPLEKVEPLAAQFSQAARQMQKLSAEYKQKVFAGSSADLSNLTPQDAERRTAVTRIADVAHEMAKYAHEAHLALYDGRNKLMLVPALNPAALERERSTKDDCQPWLDINVLRFGSEALLRGYPPSLVREVRESFDALAAAYKDGGSPSRAEKVEREIHNFSVALRKLSEAIADQRMELPARNLDKALVAYTAYPPAENMTREVHYNRIDPFRTSWIVGFVGVGCFALAFGRARKTLLWVGLAVALGALAWTTYGFYLRVMITKWAPVTNMYTTVVWVPFVVLSLGVWFTVLPVTWPAIKKGWRACAIPATWEATPLEESHERVASQGTWPVLGVLLLVPRVLLMALLFWLLTQAPYSAGDRAIINLMPQFEASTVSQQTSSTPWLTWFVGMCVLLPTVWYLPRVVLALLAAPIMIVRSWRHDTATNIQQVYPRKPFAMMATVLATFGWIVAWLGARDATVLDESFAPLMPVLRDNFWLTIHVLTMVSGYGAGLLAWGLGLLAQGYYLFGRYQEPVKGRAVAGASATVDDDEFADTLRRRPPAACAALSGYVYKAIQVAVLLLAAGTILGGLWADVSWGRFWGWDPKEVWALISLLVFLAILHGRYAGWFGNFGLAIGSSLGAYAIIWAWYGANFILPAGFHGYGSGAGGQIYVFGAMLANLVLMVAAGIRYQAETSAFTMSQPEPQRSQAPTSA